MKINDSDLNDFIGVWNKKKAKSAKKEVKRFREKVDRELAKKIKRGLEDIKHGRISEWKRNPR